MASVAALAMAAGLAVATVNAYFVRQDGGSRWRVLRTFLGWLVAFALAGLWGPMLATWLLHNVF